MFFMPERFMIDNGINKIPITPSATRYIGDGEGGPTVEKAWVNVIDLERGRYFSGDLNNWFPLDSSEVLHIREGRDTCTVTMRWCARPGAPADSCYAAPVILYDSLRISDISYIVYTGFNYDREVKPEVYAKSGYYYRTLLNYIVREVPLGHVLDLSVVPDSSAIPIDCNCMFDFGPKSILKVMYRGESPKSP
jgi:hypothetical protein